VAQDSPPGSVRPTSARLLLTGAAVGAVVGWFGGALMERAGAVVPTVPWTSVFVLLFAAAVLGALAWSTWRTVHRQRRWIDPHRAVSYLLLAKASSLVGALVAGGYLAFAARFLDDLAAPLPQQRVLRGGLVALAAVVVVVTGLLLERACRVPKGPDEDEDERGDRAEGEPAG
jgi:small-conductance mechanosensitive channel